MSGLAALAVPVGLLALAGSPAQAAPAPGSPVEVFIDSTQSSDPVDSIDSGLWGHEGPSGTDPSFLDMDFTNPAVVNGIFSDTNNIRVAFVTTSADGSAEKPNVTAGQSVDQAFGAGSWFMDAGWLATLAGSSAANDSVITVSTGAQYDAWFAAGQPVQDYDSSLVSHDSTAPGNPVSAAPKGKSILNRWPAGSHISMVFYESTGGTVNGKPIVKVGPDGKAITAYMPFTTVAKAGDPVRTSAGYVNNNPGPAAVSTTTTLAASPANTAVEGSTVTLTATVAAATGTATGSVEFFDGATSLGSSAVNGSGVATKAVSTLAVGNHNLTATYTPTGNFSTSSTAAPLPYSITAVPVTPTHLAGAVTPGADSSVAVGFSGTVSADDASCPAGSVEFKEGGTTLATDTTPDGSCVYTGSYTFPTPGSHTVTMVFTPAPHSPPYGSSSDAKTFTLAAPAGVSTDEQNIQGTIPVGTIVITTPYTEASPLDLGDLHLTSDLKQYTASASFEDIHLLDTRGGAQDWAVTALAGALANGANTINAQNVGLTNLVVDNVTGASTPFVQQPGLGTISVFNNPAADPAVAPAAAGSLGLGGTPKTIMSADQGPSDVQYKGTLTLNAPTTTPAGLYKGIITFTAS